MDEQHIEEAIKEMNEKGFIFLGIAFVDPLTRIVKIRQSSDCPREAAEIASETLRSEIVRD